MYHHDVFTVAAAPGALSQSRRGGLLVALVVILGAFHFGDARAASLIGLGDFPGGSDNSQANGVSADGLVVVGRGSSNAGNGAFRWTQAEGMVELPQCVPPSCNVFPGFLEAHDVSADGSVVVGISRGLNGEAVRWTLADDTSISLGDLPGGGNPSFNSAANGISGDGSVVVGWGTSALGVEAFRWTEAGGMVGLGVAGTTAHAVSDDGSVIVGVKPVTGGGEAFRWTQAGGMVGLGDLAGGSVDAVAYDVSADGTVVVGASRSGLGDEAFRWTQAGGMVALGDLPGGDFGSVAHAASANGAVVVGEGSVAGPAASAFYWTQAGGMQPLIEVLAAQGADVSGWDYLSVAYDVSPDGNVIVGYGTRDNFSVSEAFVAYLGDVTPGPDNITGTPGDDVLNGKGGADIMTGLAGNDTYIVDNTGDAVVEAANEGTDTVKSSVTYTLPANVEILILTGTAANNGTGNGLANTLTGNSGNNTLNGKAGADTMAGKAGNDTYFVDNAGDKVTEGLDQGTDLVKSTVSYTLKANVENLTLIGTANVNGTGNTLVNRIVGNGAANVLNGREGNDTLTGGAGPDRFLFNTALNPSANVDKITDFTPIDDQIRLENSVFTGLPVTGTLAAAAFATGTAATTAAHRIIYDPATGNVRYDADGTGPTPPVRFAQLTTRPALTRADFVVQ